MTPEQENLLRKAEHSIEAAKVMKMNGHFDFAVSRAYYSMFYLAEAFLLEKGLAFSKHSAVHAAFGEHFIRTGILPTHLHRALIHGMEVRLTGDYDSTKEVSVEEAEEQIANAEQFMEVACQRLGVAPPPSRD
ncbi:MAG TPA: HEPN domain-containing protein [Terriglobia bacterium]|nr:HEPN domain-containing protein [Terriglobia bacterium]